MSNKVVPIFGYREHRLKRIRESKGTPPSLELSESNETLVLREIKRLLTASADEGWKAHDRSLSTYQKEDAVVKGLEYLMKAHGVANENGFKIERTDLPNGSIDYHISRLEKEKKLINLEITTDPK